LTGNLTVAAGAATAIVVSSERDRKVGRVGRGYAAGGSARLVDLDHPVDAPHRVCGRDHQQR
jgi:hypothetical protein